MKRAKVPGRESAFSTIQPIRRVCNHEGTKNTKVHEVSLYKRERLRGHRGFVIWRRILSATSLMQPARCGRPVPSQREILLERGLMSTIRFQATLTAVGSQTIVKLPKAASSSLRSRGMNLVEGTFDGHAFQAPLEPDGKGSHWFKVSDTILEAARAVVGDRVSVAMVPMSLWPEPDVPADLRRALAADPQAG